MTIYIDLLFCYNMLVHFCLLTSTAAICRKRLFKRRILLGSVLGSVFSLMIFLRLSAAVFCVLKALMAAVLVFCILGYGSFSQFMRRILIFLAVNLVYAGAMLAITVFFAPVGMVYRNGVAYFGGSTPSYLLGLLLGYLLLRGFVYFLAKNGHKEQRAEVILRCGAQRVDFSAYYDSGNRATDPYSGRPVLFISQGIAEKLLGGELAMRLSKGIFDKQVQGFGHKARLLPLHTAGGSPMTISFVPDEVTVCGVCGVDWCVAVIPKIYCEQAEGLLPACYETMRLGG